MSGIPSTIYGPSGERITANSVAVLWNHDHRPEGGHGAIHEYGRVTAMGVMQDVPFLATRFTAGGTQTWTVTSADQVVLAFTLIGKMFTYHFDIATSTVGGVADPELRIALPTFMEGNTPVRYRAVNRRAYNTFWYSDNGTAGVGFARIIGASASSTGTFLSLFTMASANWTASANNTRVLGQITFEVETY